MAEQFQLRTFHTYYYWPVERLRLQYILISKEVFIYINNIAFSRPVPRDSKFLENSLS